MILYGVINCLRACLRMLEGLLHSDVMVKCLAQSWVRFVMERSELGSALQPLVCILLEPENKRKRRSSVSTPKVEDQFLAGKYFNPSFLGKKKEELVWRSEEERLWWEMAIRYTQTIDAGQVLYAIPLLRATLAVDLGSVVGSLGRTVVNLSAYASTSYRPASGDLPSADAPHSSSKSLLELLLSTSVDFLRGEYPEALEVPADDQLDNLRVKVAAADFLEALLRGFIVILAPAGEGGSEPVSAGALRNPSYVSALITLCDIQKTVVVLLAQVVQMLSEGCVTEARETGIGRSNSSAKEECSVASSQRHSATTLHGRNAVPLRNRCILESLSLSLLKVVRSLICIDSHCTPTLTAAFPLHHPTLPTKNQVGRQPSSTSLPPILPSVPTASQPFFHSFLLTTLSDFSLSSHLHHHLLSAFCSCLPYLQNQLDELAPKVIKQICKNLELIRKAETDSLHPSVTHNHSATVSPLTLEKLWSGDYIVSQLEAMVTVVLWSLFGEGLHDYLPPRGELNHHRANIFWDSFSRTVTEDTSDSLSPTSRQPSTMAWLFGVFSAGQRGGGGSEGGGRGGALPVGVGSKVGHYVVMLLPYVYNVVTELWRRFAARCGGVVGRGGGWGGALDDGMVGTRRLTIEFEVSFVSFDSIAWFR